MKNRNRRDLLKVLSGFGLAGGLIGPAPAWSAATIPATDENLPDTSTYETFQHPEMEDLDYIHDLYARADQLTAETRKELPHHLNVHYGAHLRQRVDLYLPKAGGEVAAVVIFLHGGGFEEGHRAHYGYIARPYAARGAITVVAGYRLVRDGYHYPAQVDDVRAIINWVHGSIAHYGGDPNAIYVTGHSAGALLSAEVGADRSWMPAAGLSMSILRGIVCVSGRYDLTRAGSESPAEVASAAYYAPTRELRERASPMHHIVDPVPMAIVAHGRGQEYERVHTSSSPEFVKALQRKGVDASLIVLPSATHIDTVFALGTEGSALASAVVEMLAKPSA